MRVAILGRFVMIAPDKMPTRVGSCNALTSNILTRDMYGKERSGKWLFSRLSNLREIEKLRNREIEKLIN